MTFVVDMKGEVAGPEFSYTGTGQRIQHHNAYECAEHHCCIHNPSPHHMTMWPLHFRWDRAPLMERLCRLGVGHPDPDCIAYLNSLPNGYRYAWGDHGCDGCCKGTDGYIGDK